MKPNINPDVLDDLLLAAGGRTLTEDSRTRLKALHWALISRPLVFRCPTPGKFILGHPDDLLTLDCDILAAAGVHLALSNPGRADLVRAADFAAPGVKYASNTVRNGITDFADFLEANNQRALAGVVGTVGVHAGFLVAPINRHFDLITE